MDAVKFYMDESLLTIDSGASCLEAARSMSGNKVGCLLVMENGFYTGVVTEGDLSRRVFANELSPADVAVAAIMTEPIVTVESKTSMAEAFLIMNKRKIRHILVTDQGRYVGMLSIKDFAAYYTSKFSQNQ